MLEFYEFNTFNICTVLISTFIIYYLLCKFIKDSKDSKNNKENNETSNDFSIEYLIVSVLLGFSISLIVSYIISGNDESLLTENYWDPINNEVSNE